MRITVDIEDSVLEDVMAMTGEKMKSPAVAKAVEQFVKRAKAREFGKKLREGHFDYALSDEQVRELDR
jgi:Arc/MetJ family transcription regulator